MRFIYKFFLQSFFDILTYLFDYWAIILFLEMNTDPLVLVERTHLLRPKQTLLLSTINFLCLQECLLSNV